MPENIGRKAVAHFIKLLGVGQTLVKILNRRIEKINVFRVFSALQNSEYSYYFANYFVLYKYI